MTTTTAEYQKQLSKLFPSAQIMDDESKLVENRFGGASIMLNPLEIAIYDLSIGAEMLQEYTIVRKCIDWFIDNNVEAYSVLLD